MFVLALIEHDRRKIISTDANLDAVNVKIEVLDKSSAPELIPAAADVYREQLGPMSKPEIIGTKDRDGIILITPDDQALWEQNGSMLGAGWFSVFSLSGFLISKNHNLITVLIAQPTKNNKY